MQHECDANASFMLRLCDKVRAIGLFLECFFRKIRAAAICHFAKINVN
jgi:hypothetical protein